VSVIDKCYLYARVFVPGHPSLIFLCKTRSLPKSGALERYFTLGKAPYLTHNDLTGLENPARDNYSGL